VELGSSNFALNFLFLLPKATGTVNLVSNC